ncbi:MAG: dihydrofolate reductase [Bifidobacteriaceae bacterium]|nr:dihydrofolate reductase [Bifidobacteriaceae bacterium]
MNKKISLIWAEAYHKDGKIGAIGYKGKIPWYIPEDLKHFSDLTKGGTVIMGRKTWDSLPENVRPLPNRKNIILTNHPENIKNHNVLALSSLKEAISRSNTENIWIIGGEKIYKAATKYASDAYITRVRKKVVADTSAPKLSFFWKQVSKSDWMLSRNGEQYCFYKYSKIKVPINFGKIISSIEDTYIKHNIAFLSRKRKITFDTYISYGTQNKIRLLGRAILASSKQNPNELRRGFRTLAAAQVPKIDVHAAIDGKPLAKTLKTDRGGYIDEYVNLELSVGRHQVEFWADDSTYKSKGDLLIIDKSTKYGIISDIDDTIIITKIPSIFLAIYNSLFLRPEKRQAVYGMKRLFETLNEKFFNPAFFYVSTSPWNVFKTVKNFIKANNFPYSPFILRDFGPTGDKIYLSGREHKMNAIQQIFGDFPETQWILIGDDGQIDPSIYRDITDLYPEKIKAIIIRRLTGTELFLNHIIPVSFEAPFIEKVSYKSIPIIAANDGYKLRQLVENILNS